MPLRFKTPPPPADGPVFERAAAREARVGAGVVRRALPHPKRRLVGGWCFADHFGPTGPGAGMGVGPHPHIGLQTVTWLLEGQVRHRDSIGSDQVIRAGQVNWMTAGRGIAHAEDGENGPGQKTHGVQLWVALPDAARHGPPAFQHIAAPPQVDLEGATGTLLAGTVGGVLSPARTASPLLGLDLQLPDDRRRSVPLDPAFEHAVLVLEGAVAVAGERVEPGVLAYLGRGRAALEVAGAPAGRLLLLGGLPLGEPVQMWWNYVFRTPDELREVISDWNRGDSARFPAISGSLSPRIPSPAFPG